MLTIEKKKSLDLDFLIADKDYLLISQYTKKRRFIVVDFSWNFFCTSCVCTRIYIYMVRKE